MNRDLSTSSDRRAVLLDGELGRYPAAFPFASFTLFGHLSWLV